MNKPGVSPETLKYSVIGIAAKARSTKGLRRKFILSGLTLALSLLAGGAAAQPIALAVDGAMRRGGFSG